jgi:futalosine hydrolase
MTSTSPVRLLVVTAVAAERDAVAAGLPRDARSPDGAELTAAALTAEVLAAGVGPAAAAAATAAELTAAALGGTPYDLVVSAGIGGGFAPLAAPGTAVIASRIVAADLGATTADGFADVGRLGFGTAEHLPPPDTARAAALAAGALLAPVLTVSTVTGTAARAAELADRHPGAGAEAMEGFGVAEAAVRAGLPVLEVRTVSNAVGPRNRAAWRVPEALRALTATMTALAPVLAGHRRSPAGKERP